MFVDSLATAPGWLTSQAQLQALDSLCVTRGAHQNVKSFLQDWAQPVPIIYTNEPDTWQVVQYHSLPSVTALENKLAQFPRGTRFQLSPFGFSNQMQQAQAFERLKPFLEKRGMWITEQPLLAR